MPTIIVSTNVFLVSYLNWCIVSTSQSPIYYNDLRYLYYLPFERVSGVNSSNPKDSFFFVT